MKSFLVCLLLFHYLICFAQKPDITDNFSLTVGPKYKRISNTNEYRFVYGQKMLTLKKSSNAFATQRHSLQNLTKLPSTSFIPDKGTFISTMQLKDTVLIYYSQKNKLLSQKIQISTKESAKSKTVINSTQKIADDFGFTGKFGYDAGNRINAFGIKKSVDQSKYVIIYTESVTAGNGEGLIKNITNGNAKKALTGNLKRILNVQVYNADQSLLWQKRIEMPYILKKMNADDFMVDSEGNFFVLASVFEKERLASGKRNKEDTNFNMEIFKLTKDSQDWEIKKISTDKSIEDAVLYLNNAKEPVLLGFYAEKELKGYITGAFNANIEKATLNISPILHPIPSDTLKAYEQRKTIQIKQGIRRKKNLDDLEKIHINNVVIHNDGSFSIFAEQRFAKRNSYYANGATVVKYDYYYKTAYACKADGVGNMLWFNQLPKNQYSKRGKQAMSYQTLQFGEFYHVLVWDKFSNLYKNTGQYADFLNTEKKGYMFLKSYKINLKTGKVVPLTVLNSLEVDRYKLYGFKMDKAVLINESDIIFEGNSGKSNYLFRLKLNK